jgi:hypothetical protein
MGRVRSNLSVWLCRGAAKSTTRKEAIHAVEDLSEILELFIYIVGMKLPALKGVLLATLALFAVACEPIIPTKVERKKGTTGVVFLDQGSYQASFGIPKEWRFLEVTDTPVVYNRYSAQPDCFTPDDNDTSQLSLALDEWRNKAKLGYSLTQNMAIACPYTIARTVRDFYHPGETQPGDWHIASVYELNQAWKFFAAEPDKYSYIFGRTYYSSDLYYGDVVCLYFPRPETGNEPTSFSVRPVSSQFPAVLLVRAF